MAATPIAMPRLGMTMEEGTVIEWPIPVGQRVEKGQVLLVIETEKAETEIEASTPGVFRHSFADPGETLPCGALLGVLTDDADEDFDAASFEQSYTPPPGLLAEKAAPTESLATPAAATPAQKRGARKAVVPAARALAKKLDLELERITGTGPKGRVTKQDVEEFAAARERLVVVDGGVGIEVLKEGSGDPVLLLPGFGSDVSCFALQTPALAELFEVFGINPRGVGSSDAPALDTYEVGRAAEDVAAIAEGPAHVVGASLGAATAIEFALRHPDKVRSLTLITPFVLATPRLLAFAKAWTRVAAEGSPHTLAAFLAPWLFGDALLGDDIARTRTLRGLAQSVKRIPAATLERSAAGMAEWSGTRADGLSEITAPTLVLAAGADLLTPSGAAVAAAIPNAKCELIEGCGHALAIDAAEDVTRMLLSHLSG